MKNMRMSLSLACMLMLSTTFCSHASEGMKKNFGESWPYNAAHIVSTGVSYPVALTLTLMMQFSVGLMMGFGGMPNIKSPLGIALVATGMFCSGPFLGVGLVAATPHLTNKALRKLGYLTKDDAPYTRNEAIMHSGVRVLAFFLLYRYGNQVTNTIKSRLFRYSSGC